MRVTTMIDQPRGRPHDQTGHCDVVADLEEDRDCQHDADAALQHQRVFDLEVGESCCRLFRCPTVAPGS